MNPTSHNELFKLTEAMSVLEATPAVLRALLGNLPDVWREYQEEPSEWSPRIILVHFVHNEQTNWVPRLKVILSDDAVRQFDPFRQLPEGGALENLTVNQLLEAFESLRKENLTALWRLDLKPEHYSREAAHPVLGVVTLRQLLATWVVHDMNHTYQITKSIAKRYRDAVGPWRPNLSILDL
jgi:hypothetical protein